MRTCRLTSFSVSILILVVFVTIELVGLASTVTTAQAIRSWMLTLFTVTLGTAGVVWVVERLKVLYDEVHEAIIRGLVIANYKASRRTNRKDNVSDLFPDTEE